MTKSNNSDPLELVSVRLPKSLIVELHVRAGLQSTSDHRVTLSDVMRQHIDFAKAKPLGIARPRRRESALVAFTPAADPALMRQIAAIGSNLNQLARAINRLNGDHEPAKFVQILTVLVAMERSLADLVAAQKGVSYAH